MDTTHFFTDQWASVAQLLPANLEQSARDWKALQRKRKIRSAEDLLRLALMYGFCDESLRLTAGYTMAAGIAKMSDVAVLDRLKAAAPWLGHVVLRFLQDRGLTTPVPRFRVRVVDATVVSEPGSRGTDWRFHMGLDLAQARIASVELTGPEGGETFLRHSVYQDEIMLGDRGYAHRGGVASVIDRKGHIVVRISWQNFPLLDWDGRGVDILALLQTLQQPGDTGEWAVQFEANERRYQVRLVATRKAERDVVKERRRVAHEARRKRRTPDPRSLQAAQFIAVITDLPAEVLPASEALELYRLRWQIEIAFKQLTGIMHLDHLRAKDEALAEAYLYAGILGALIVQELCRQEPLFSPRRARFARADDQRGATDGVRCQKRAGRDQRPDRHRPSHQLRPSVQKVPMR